MSLFLPFSASQPHGCLVYPTTLRSVGFQQILLCVAVQAALADVLALLVLALVTEKAVWIFDPGEVKFAGLLDQQKMILGIPSGWVLSLKIVTPLSQSNTLMARLFNFSTYGI